MKWRKSKVVAPEPSIFPDETGRFWLEDERGNILTDKAEATCRVNPATGETNLISGQLTVIRSGYPSRGCGYFRGLKMVIALNPPLLNQATATGDTVTFVDVTS